MTLLRILIIVVVFVQQSFGQNIHSKDLLLINTKKIYNANDYAYYKRQGNDTKVMQNHKHTFISQINPLSYILKASMLLYQNVLSPQLSKTCAYQITCSNFSKQAITKFGIVKGIFLSADRLMRCNRIAVLDVSLNDIDEQTGGIIDSLNRY